MCEVATVVRIARPSAPPICWDVLISPEARPASRPVTPASAAIEIGTNVNPSPVPRMMNPGKRSVKYEPVGEICVKRTRPVPTSARPPSSAGLTPVLVTIACAAPDETTAVRATAR